jgi:KaiC/GvpD/RAD55 family RecA-like ATPase
LQYLLEGRLLGEKCVYINLSETKEELAAGAASHGWSLDGIEIVNLTAFARFEDRRRSIQAGLSEPSGKTGRSHRTH